MYFKIYDAGGKLRFESDNWPMARSALDLVVSEAKGCPRLEICPEKEKDRSIQRFPSLILY